MESRALFILLFLFGILATISFGALLFYLFKEGYRGITKKQFTGIMRGGRFAYFKGNSAVLMGICSWILGFIFIGIAVSILPGTISSVSFEFTATFLR